MNECPQCRSLVRADAPLCVACGRTRASVAPRRFATGDVLATRENSSTFISVPAKELYILLCWLAAGALCWQQRYGQFPTDPRLLIALAADGVGYLVGSMVLGLLPRLSGLVLAIGLEICRLFLN